jgi:hypothetical protein
VVTVNNGDDDDGSGNDDDDDNDNDDDDDNDTVDNDDNNDDNDDDVVYLEQITTRVTQNLILPGYLKFMVVTACPIVYESSSLPSS